MFQGVNFNYLRTLENVVAYSSFSRLFWTDSGRLASPIFYSKTSAIGLMSSHKLPVSFLNPNQREICFFPNAYTFNQPSCVSYSPESRQRVQLFIIVYTIFVFWHLQKPCFSTRFQGLEYPKQSYQETCDARFCQGWVILKCGRTKRGPVVERPSWDLLRRRSSDLCFKTRHEVCVYSVAWC